ncbi:hypothetical protein B0H11DRAFT_2096420 [Mycena galericulata]|nr:hypothetical protein B0H11DRAFT_2096420 [Mycena galericulata]
MTSKEIAAESTHFLQFRLQYSSLALLYYDFALTFPKEVKYMWGQRFRLSTAFYIGCRYALVANVLYLLAVAHKLGSTVCDFWYQVVVALSVVGRAAVISVFTMRTYVVWGKNKWVLAYMGVVGFACVVLDIMHIPGTRCVGSSTPEMLSIMVVIFESSSAFLTTVKCVIAFRRGGLANQRHGVLFVIFEQGSCRAFVISIFTTAGVILNYAGFFQRLLDAFTLPLSCLLTARFILFLRKWDAAQVEQTLIRGPTTILEFRSTTRVGVLSSLVALDDFAMDPVSEAATKHQVCGNKTDPTDITDVESEEERNLRSPKMPIDLV